MRTIKKYVYILLPLMTIFGSCEDIGFLDKEPLSNGSPDNYYQSVKEFETALMGCYDAINMSSLPGRNVSMGTYMYGLQYMLSGGTDELIIGASAPAGEGRNQYGIANYNINSEGISDLWLAYYAGIMRCNVLLDKAVEFDVSGAQTQAQMTQIVAEARFLRAFFYYHLASLFGGIPLNTSSSVDPLAPRASLEAVYTELIIPDLLFAKNNLSPTAPFAGRASAWTAKGYLGVVYNYLAACKRYGAGENLNFPLNSFQWVDAGQMSTEAKDILQDVVENSPYRLIDRYDYLFRETTKSYQQEECLFTAEYALVNGGDAFPDINYLFCPAGNVQNVGGSWGGYRPTIEFARLYNSNIDIRYAHNITAPYTTNIEKIDNVDYFVPGASSGPEFWNNQTGKYRHMAPYEKTIRVNGSAISVPLLRFADILLQYAEALYFTGDEPLARSYFEPVRERVTSGSNSVDDLTAEYNRGDFIVELLEERSRELCYESKRRIDLFRFNKLNDAIQALEKKDTGPNTRVRDLQTNWKPYKIWFPIPLRETGLNPNLANNQNPGY